MNVDQIEVVDGGGGWRGGERSGCLVRAVRANKFEGSFYGRKEGGKEDNDDHSSYNQKLRMKIENEDGKEQ